jgi:hemolysin activation/secretion protein
MMNIINNERGKKMKYNHKSSQILMGVIASLLIANGPAMATGAAVSAAKAAESANKAMAAQDKAMKAPIKALAAPTAGLVKSAKAEPQQIAQGADSIRFVLNGISIEGNSAIKEEKLKEFYSGKIGKEIVLSEVYAIAEDMETFYRKSGYEFSRVLVPAQKASGGMIKLVVVETVLGKVTFQGQLQGRQGVMETIREALLASKPLRNADLERYVLLLNDIPGVDAVATLSKSDTPNATDVTFELKSKPFDIALVVDNSKPKNLGTQQAMVSASLNNMMGMYEKLSVTAATDFGFEKSRYVRGSLAALLHGEGTMATVSGTYSDTKPIGTDTPGATVFSTSNGVNKGWGVDIAHPFVRSRAMNLRMNAGFDYKNSKTTITSADAKGVATPTQPKPTESNFRSADVGVTFDIADATGGVTVFNLDGELGIDALEATPSVTLATLTAGKKTDGKTFSNNFKKFGGSIMRLQTFTGAPGLSIQASLTGQYAMDPLPSSKEFSFGGREYGRGLDSGIASGDHGFAGKLELRFAIPQNVIKTIQPYVFGEYGSTWNRDDKTIAAGKAVAQTDKDTLSAWTAGGGLKVDLLDYVSAYAEAAWVLKPSDGLKASGGLTPAKDAKAGDPIYDQANANARFFAGLTLRY